MSMFSNNITFADEEFDNKVVTLKQHLKSRMNGKTTEQMQNGQIDYTINYGVSLEHVKELADLLRYSADDCRKIWRLNIREAMLIAAISMPSDATTADEMFNWASYIHTPDMAEQASFFLFWRSTDVTQLLDMLIDSDIEYSMSIITFTAGRALQKNISMPDSTVINIINKAQSLNSLRPHEARGLSLLLRQALKKGTMTDTIKDLVTTFSATDDNIKRQIAFEVEAELEMNV